MAHITNGDLVAGELTKDSGDFFGFLKQALAEQLATMPAGPGRNFLETLITGLGTFTGGELDGVAKSVSARYLAARRDDYLAKAAAATDHTLRAGYQELAFRLRPSR